MMLRKGNREDVASFVRRTLLEAVEEQAEFVYFELKQHDFLIRFRWAFRMRTIWRGPRSEGTPIMAFVKVASGMDADKHRVPQSGQYTFASWDGDTALPAICKPYLSEEKVVLSGLSLLRNAEPPAADLYAFADDSKTTDSKATSGKR